VDLFVTTRQNSVSSYLVRVVERTGNLRLVFQLCHSFVFVLSFMLYHFVQGKIWDEGVLVASTTDRGIQG